MKSTNYPYIIAEIGCNHNGDLDLAKKMIDSAKDCGCDSIKLQLWKKEELITNKHLKELDSGKVKLENVPEWKTKELGLNNIFEQTDKFSIYYDEHIELFDYARSIGIGFSSTPVTKEGIDFLIDCKVDFIKIASMDINNIDFLEYAVSKDYPIVVSTGLASLGEIERFVDMVPKKNREKVAILHCISLYPPEDSLVNLNFIKTLKRLFDVKIGYSDHSLGTSIPLAAVSLGAEMIEKHFTLDKDMPGWDHKVSANPEEMKIICTESKRISNALGNGRKVVTSEEMSKRNKFRRSLILTKELRKGDTITNSDLTYKRPGTGIAPDEYKYVIGRKLNKDKKYDDLLKWEDLV